MLNVLFICGSLEPGKDGVGDFVWRLASRLVKLGYSCACVSLNDDFVSPSTDIFDITDFEDNLFRYRISSKHSWKEKISLLNVIALKVKPSFISFHYGPYTYSSRGIPVSLVYMLPRLDFKCYWHFMLHELWVDPSLKPSHKLLNPVQKLLLKFLVSRISPRIINTSNSYYVRQLSGIGVKSEKFTLFSNIKLISTSSKPVDPSAWSFLFFGSIHPEWEHNLLLNAIDLVRVKNDIQICNFILVGHAGNYGVGLWCRLASESSPYFNFINLGELSPKKLSYQLQIADFGVTTTPSHLIEKSGSVAAMLAHGLPIIIPRVTNKLPDFNKFLETNDSYILLKKDHELDLVNRIRPKPVDQLEASTKQFIASLLSVK